MRTDVARLDVTTRWRSTTGYVVGTILYTIVVVALYPAFQHSTALDDLVRNDPTAAALFGVTGEVSTSSGWLNANIYANLFPLVMLLMTVGYGASSLAGQNEQGTLCLLVTLPLRRASLAAQKVGAMVIQALVLAVGVAASVLVGRAFELSITAGRAAAVSTTVLLMGLDFGLLAMVVGALTGKRGTALGVGTVVAAASYLVSSLAPVASWIRPLRFASLFYWSVGNDQLGQGVRAADFAVLAVTGAALAAAALFAFRRFDVT